MCKTLSVLWVRLLFLSSLVLFLLSCSSSTAQQDHHHRRVLHHPFFPRISVPPTQPPTTSPQPQPKLQPKLPFSSSSSSSSSPSSSSSSSPHNPFFPSYRTPPLPPSPTIVATFPANISSLLLPRPYSRHHRSIIAVAVSLSLLSVAILGAATVFAHHRLSRRHTAADDDDDKASRSDNRRLFPPNTATSDGGDRTEFLYLGTVASSDEARGIADSSCGSNGGFRPPYRKQGDSPELKPLPPLTRGNFRVWASEEDDEGKKEEEEEEEFFSPKGSSGNRQQSPPSSPCGVALAASSSRSSKVFQFDKFGSRSFTSRTPSYPRSNSLSNSVSRSPSLNLSPRSVKSLPPQNPASPFSSSSSSPKPVEDLSSSWDFSGQGKDSEAVKLPPPPPSPPPPPPPPPPPRFWETPVLARLGEDVGVKNENEESPKPKLKALHWDKVKASSDRAMVWDRLRPSSFQ